MKFKDLKLWERKLNYVIQLRDDVLAFNTSYHDHEQSARYNSMLTEAERRVKEYTELVDYLKGVEK